MMKYNPYKVLIISSWSLLIVCFVLYLLGANWFTAGTDSKVFIAICAFIDTKLWLKAIIMCLTSLILNSFVSLAVLQQKMYTVTQAGVFIPVILFMSLIGWYNDTLQLMFNLIHFALPVAFAPKKWLRALCSVPIVFSFQVISVVIKNVMGLHLDENTPTLIALILQLDTLIMCALYYLYSIKRKEV